MIYLGICASLGRILWRKLLGYRLCLPLLSYFRVSLAVLQPQSWCSPGSQCLRDCFVPSQLTNSFPTLRLCENSLDITEQSKHK
jgi:hypothetical protein